MVDGPVCRSTWNATLDGPIRDYVLPPICVPRVGSASKSVVLAAFLNTAPNIHGGAFRKSVDLVKHVRDLLHRSPGICPRQLHVIHDKENITDTECCGGVTLHRFAGDVAHLGNDQRWPYVQQVLRKPTVAWHCAFVIDFDVSVFCLPPCEEEAALAAPSKLIVSGEVCKISPKQWLWAHSIRMGRDHLARSVRTWPLISRMLHDQGPMFNCAMVGGRRDVFEPALDAVVADYTRLWRTRSTHYWSGADMLLWNGQALKRGFEQVVTGYPHGPVNLPLDGKLAAHTDGTLYYEMCLNIDHRDPANGTAPCKSKECILDWAANVSLNRYYFGHKLPNWWLTLARNGVLKGRHGTCGTS